MHGGLIVAPCMDISVDCKRRIRNQSHLREEEVFFLPQIGRYECDQRDLYRIAGAFSVPIAFCGAVGGLISPSLLKSGGQ